MVSGPRSPLGLHRVVATPGEPTRLPQAAWRLDPDPAIGPDEVRVDVERLNLDAASFRQLREQHGTGDAVREAVLAIVAERGKMQNPVTGSGGMLVGTVAEVGPQSTTGLRVGDRVATLVSLSLTPLHLTDGLSRWDGTSERIPAQGHAILFGRTIAARLPEDLDPALALMVMDVCGAPALVRRVIREHRVLTGVDPSVLVLGGAGKSGSLCLAMARAERSPRVVAVVRDDTEAQAVDRAALATHVVVADARDPLGLTAAVDEVGGPVDLTVVCVDVPGCEQPAILVTRDGGTCLFFSMATSFSAAALGAEGLAADVRLLMGNGYVPGHAELALSLIRENPGVRGLFDQRLAEEGA
ncbi:L-erythro-3,5-diaminohexanoate dehydrogenase [Arsenicicoccus piscis]|uniref:L-erythro-3,5-diaminohexanoate dehydrogenase n=1 Tax=Arsenicicoccus piscis TaxID=673954 RepID=UPI001F4CA3FE|nr:L-erythro-3,5-diaminohexanoate dehydrogenase [Arsenicicoccus piscis]MCH8628376.1 L-erythro-3,5-diaminohexanoate dehydrogenase [Arsenicicoccus piscis]